MLKLYNTLTKQKETFKPLNPPKVGLYTCGPTVYDYAHIGNFRTFIFEDLLRRTLEYNGFQVKHVMNITDVGHLTSDADTGEDKLEKGAQREGKTVQEVAKHYTDAFLRDLEKLNIKKAHFLPKATDHITEQIELIKRLEARGLVYQTSTGVYFDVMAYQRLGYDYTVLTGQSLEEKMVGAREEVVTDPQKKHPADFALWLFTVGHFADHAMRWPSSWGEGFPGWHLECSALSGKYLGQPFDIHTGGEDHIPVHHTNEIAQSSGAYGQPQANYWLHGAFMMVDDGRMGKSGGNAYLVSDLEGRGYAPLAFRYLCLMTHYRSKLNFTWEGLEAAQNALKRLRKFARGVSGDGSEQLGKLGEPDGQTARRSDILEHRRTEAPSYFEFSEYHQRFKEAINDDLNTPQALAVVWDLVKYIRNVETRHAPSPRLLQDFDKVLGLDLFHVPAQTIPQVIKRLVDEREQHRQKGHFDESDRLRQKVLELGYTVEDTPAGPKVRKNLTRP